MNRDKRTTEKVSLVIHRNPTVVTQSLWYTGCQYLNHGNKTANINVKNCSLSTSYNGEITHRKTAKTRICAAEMAVRYAALVYFRTSWERTSKIEKLR